MGLDMYLTKEINLYGKDKEKLEIKGIDGIDVSKVETIIEEVAYWRKVNAIHNWFVHNVQEGKDDCNKYYVDRKNIVKLLEIIKTILSDNTKSEELLPSIDGFFFGGTEYDEFYFNGLKGTKTMLEEILKKDDFDKFTYYYQSSW